MALSASKIDTLSDGNAARSKIYDFRTALYPRQHHSSALEKPLVKRFFAYKVFFRRACQRKNGYAAKSPQKQEFWFINKLKPHKCGFSFYFKNKRGFNYAVF